MILSVTSTSMDIREGAPIIFRGKESETLKQIHDIGYRGVEMHIHDSSCYNYDQLKELLLKYELELTSIGTGSAYGKEGLCFTSSSEEKRTGAIKRICDHITAAADFKHAVVILGLIRGRVRDCESLEVYEQRLMEALKVCSEYAKEKHVILGLEMMNRYECDHTCTIKEGLELLKKVGSPALKLHLDTYHMNIEERNIRDAILEAGDAIGHVHLADNDRWYPGHAHYNFGETIQALKDIGYQGAVAVEAFQYPDSGTAARESIKYMNQFLG